MPEGNNQEVAQSATPLLDAWREGVATGTRCMSVVNGYAQEVDVKLIHLSWDGGTREHVKIMRREPTLRKVGWVGSSRIWLYPLGAPVEPLRVAELAEHLAKEEAWCDIGPDEDWELIIAAAKAQHAPAIAAARAGIEAWMAGELGMAQ